METGSEVRIKDKITGEKVRGVITNIEVRTDIIDVTSNGMFGNEPDMFRRSMPGRSTRTITIEVTE